jgi:DNA-binding NarL/FixJ family response regulator
MNLEKTMGDPWILCVDDDEKLLSGIELQLSFEYDVRIANGGEVGLNLLRQDSGCGVIISDMRMPGIVGWATRFAPGEKWLPRRRALRTTTGLARSAIRG